jgi:type IV pilus assembly protein PilC
MISSALCEEIIGEIKNNVREGKLLAEPMTKSGFFPPMTVQMILVGEETGELAKMLKRVAEFYQDYVQTFMKRFGAMLEPIMLVVMGAIIGTIVIAMFLPIFDMSKFGR